jgi:hypothetical protein
MLSLWATGVPEKSSISITGDKVFKDTTSLTLSFGYDLFKSYTGASSLSSGR